MAGLQNLREGGGGQLEFFTTNPDTDNRIRRTREAIPAHNLSPTSS